MHASLSLQDLSACLDASHVAAGLYGPSLAMRLAHLCDTVVGLEAVRDDSDIVRLIPEPARCCLLLLTSDHQLQTIRVFILWFVCHCIYITPQVCCHILAATRSTLLLMHSHSTAAPLGSIVQLLKAVHACLMDVSYLHCCACYVSAGFAFQMCLHSVGIDRHQSHQHDLFGWFCSCCGLLHLQKLPSLNALGAPIPDVTLFIIRHKRRRLAIQASTLCLRYVCCSLGCVSHSC